MWDSNNCLANLIAKAIWRSQILVVDEICCAALPSDPCRGGIFTRAFKTSRLILSGRAQELAGREDAHPGLRTAPARTPTTSWVPAPSTCSFHWRTQERHEICKSGDGTCGPAWGVWSAVARVGPWQGQPGTQAGRLPPRHPAHATPRSSRCSSSGSSVTLSTENVGCTVASAGTALPDSLIQTVAASPAPAPPCTSQT